MDSYALNGSTGATIRVSPGSLQQRQTTNTRSGLQDYFDRFYR